ncbi:DUF3472 domain-containing protein [Mucilaginibacter antarcticus]|uniref:DUF3472 domain-containing protein n=2 Tax=Mucilaginibacter antarcticus TaxID=1855725 RepID=A0ABW5XP41_9SPHI
MKVICKALLTVIFVATAICAVSAPIIDTSIVVPLGGNAWLTPNAKARIGEQGLTRWTENNDVINVYFRAENAGDLNVALKLRTGGTSSQISINLLDRGLTKTVSATDFSVVHFGKVIVKEPGYIKIEIHGYQRKGNVFADIADVVLSGPATKGNAAYVKDNHGNFFYWGRRGPSVHLNYTVPAENKNTTEWFYNEVIVPMGQDVLGTYYMANGFTGGYFGMQVNSPTTRRILFSVWSPYTTDDPKSIPEHLKVKLMKKGAAVHGGEFGGEGSGGQSYMDFPWVAGKTYCFLVRAQGDIAAETTIYTAYFKPLEAAEWQLVASFKRPQSGSYLKGLHSFLENFDPAMGNKPRKVLYGNQWIVDIDGKWYPLDSAVFTGDETANINFRKDYAGGLQGNRFYLQNCGFFNDFVKLKSAFKRPLASQQHPEVDFSKLP